MSIPGDASPLVLGGGAQQYKIERSLRFNSSDSAYLSRVFSSTGDRQKWTFSTWIKKTGNSYSIAGLFCAGTGSNSSYDGIVIGANNTDTLAVGFANSAGNANDGLVETTQVFRDPSAWYHIVVAADTTQATASNRLRFYVNGTEITTFSSTTYPSLNYQFNFFSTSTTHAIGCGAGSFLAARFFSGYIADTQFIGGQALTPSSFAETNATTGQWVPKAYTGTYGTNGFRLAFADNSNNTATTLGKDSSPNGNNWTPNNLSVTAGAGNDSLVDTPTSYGTDTGAGGEVRGNYATLNPLAAGVGVTLANGNLDVTTSAAASVVTGTFGISTGKWYFEVTVNAGSSQYFHIGIARNNVGLSSTYLGQDANGWGYGALTGQIYNNSIATNYGNTWSAGDIIGVAFDADAGNLYFYKNGTIQNSGTAAFTGLTSGPYLPAVSDTGNPFTINGTLNFGQRPFAYTAPSGFKALCDTNLPAPVVAKPNTAFDVKLYTGNSSSQTISGLGFSPDLVWIKSRTNPASYFAHWLFDTVRGTNKGLSSNLTDAEQTFTDTLTSFDSTGFAVGSNLNQNTIPYVAWAWDAGSSTVTNTQGSITSQVRANASAGFSIVTYTGPGSSNSTVGHGLGVAPELIITKNRDRSIYWIVYSKVTGKDAFLRLNTTDASTTSNNVWGTAGPTSTVFGGVGTDLSNGFTAGEKIVSYCFATVAGYSSFGSYTGNGSTDGPFVYTGFRPRWILLKASSIGGGNYSWRIWDAVRDSYNASVRELFPNLSNSESADGPIDILSNGFKLRDTFEGRNQNATTYIYAAFAENPFQYARAR